jgi:16S rRNA (cytosine1402-N4)-methyltransferase
MRHIPVLLSEVLQALQPKAGETYIDATFGAGGYTRAILELAPCRVLALDRDPEAVQAGHPLTMEFQPALTLVKSEFSALAEVADKLGISPVDGVVLDIGVSSMQIDRAERGFSFLRDGPLDMRMEQAGPSAADLVNDLPEAALADILHHYGEERQARRIARRIVAARRDGPVETTLALARIVEGALPPARPGQPHPATRSFQALRIAVNDELGELVRGLSAAERVLAPGGMLAVVTFHSLEDRIVKRFLQLRGGEAPGPSRHAPERAEAPAGFRRVTRRALGPEAVEAEANPRARSAKLRVAQRLDAPAGRVDAGLLGLPAIGMGGR